jgi:hypothetical protein
MKGKVCEALAAGLPLITTSCGVQGLAIRDWHGARVADTSEGLTEAIAWALSHTNASEAMGAEGQQIINEVCGSEVVGKRVQEMIATCHRKPTKAQILAWTLRASAFKAWQRARRLAQLCGAGRLKRRVIGGGNFFNHIQDNCD